MTDILNRVGAVPRSIAEEATKGTEYPGKLKFKERARDSYHVDEPLLLGESGYVSKPCIPMSDSSADLGDD